MPQQSRQPTRSADVLPSNPTGLLITSPAPGVTSQESWIIDTSCFSSCTLPSSRPALTLEVSSPVLSPASVSGSRSPFSPTSLSTESSPSPPHHRSIADPHHPLSVTVQPSPTLPTPSPPPLPLDCCPPQPILEATLSNLLSSGLSATRRFSYPPSSHSFTSPSPRAKPAAHYSSSTEPPVRVTSPGLMSPTAASTLFQALDRKRAFRPYQPPVLARGTFHRVEVQLTVEGVGGDEAVPVRLMQVDGVGERLVAVGVERGRAVLWAVGLDESMLLVSLQEEGGVGGGKAVGYLSLHALLDDREVRVGVRGGEGGEERQWEVRAEVKAVESLRWECGEDRRRLCERLHESSALRRRVEQREGEESRARVAKAGKEGGGRMRGGDGEVKV